MGGGGSEDGAAAAPGAAAPLLLCSYIQRTNDDDDVGCAPASSMYIGANTAFFTWLRVEPSGQCRPSLRCAPRFHQNE